MAEMMNSCVKHQKTVGGFTILYNYEEGEDNTCPVCKIQLKIDSLTAENKRLNTIIDNRAEDMELKEKYLALTTERDELKKDNEILHKRLNDLASQGMKDMGFKIR